jgi:hypothetical protein
MVSSSGPGRPAIRPTQAGTPAFTETDVREYLATNVFPGGVTLSGASPAITEIMFVTSKQASDIMKGEYVGLPHTAPVCYVQLQGPFSSESHSSPKGARPATYQLGEMVFDAQTGNLLMWGVR